VSFLGPGWRIPATVAASAAVAGGGYKDGRKREAVAGVGDRREEVHRKTVRQFNRTYEDESVTILGARSASRPEQVLPGPRIPPAISGWVSVNRRPVAPKIPLTRASIYALTEASKYDMM